MLPLTMMAKLMKARKLILFGLLLLLATVGVAIYMPLSAEQANTTTVKNVALKAIASGLASPWSVAFLPDGKILVTEKPGRLRVIEHGKLLAAPVAGVPIV
ncbi:MAG: PQQ-dependent sugar dehydrogenase, partial [Legionella sp.]|nr:PQQ-dependent sugar dehydrogenase [Legionella sp.]